MRSDPAARAALSRLAVITGALAVFLVLRAGPTGLALRLWLVAVGATLTAALLGRALAGLTLAGTPRARLRLPWRRSQPPDRLRQLEALEHATGFALATAFDVHYRLRPHLARIAAHRLASRGVRLEMQPVRARALLGDEAWELVRPDRPAPDNRGGSGLPAARLRRVVEALDGL